MVIMRDGKLKKGIWVRRPGPRTAGSAWPWFRPRAAYDQYIDVLTAIDTLGRARFPGKWNPPKTMLGHAILYTPSEPAFSYMEVSPSEHTVKVRRVIQFGEDEIDEMVDAAKRYQAVVDELMGALGSGLVAGHYLTLDGRDLDPPRGAWVMQKISIAYSGYAQTRAGGASQLCRVFVDRQTFRLWLEMKDANCIAKTTPRQAQISNLIGGVVQVLKLANERGYRIPQKPFATILSQAFGPLSTTELDHILKHQSVSALGRFSEPGAPTKAAIERRNAHEAEYIEILRNANGGHRAMTTNK
ncbi:MULTISPECIES: hypothetical protein [unclassified Mesorhizobium]|uniref:hypothetical protein n=1 Tax=unclassified Mesorhizobium TaxID=325217 RepID=UPI00333D6828